MKSIFQKLSKDNIGVLASIVSWNVLASLVPILVGLIAISGFVLRGNPSAQQSVISHLSQALQGVLILQRQLYIIAGGQRVEGIEDLLPDPGPAPALIARVHGFPGAEPLGEISLGGAIPGDPEDAS